MRRYPLEPLAQVMGMSLNAACEALGVSGSTQKDYRERGVTWRVADSLAGKAGFHVTEIWPEWADDSIAAAEVPCDECGTSFMPHQRNHRFCSKRCKSRHNTRTHYHRDPRSEVARTARWKRENAEYYRAAERRRYHEQKEVA